MEAHRGVIANSSWQLPEQDSNSGVSLKPVYCMLLLQRIGPFIPHWFIPFGAVKDIVPVYSYRRSARCSYTCVTQRCTTTWASYPHVEFFFMDHQAVGRHYLHMRLLGWGLLTFVCFCSFVVTCFYFFSLVNSNQTWRIFRRTDPFILFMLLFVRWFFFFFNVSNYMARVGWEAK